MATATSASTGTPSVPVSTAKSAIAKKLEKVLSLRLDQSDRDLVEALRSLSSSMPENTLRARRNLRGDMERRLQRANEELLAELERVKGAVDRVADDIESMGRGCDAMRVQLNTVKAATDNIVVRAGALRQESRVLSAKQAAAKSFVDRFQLTPEQLVELADERNDDTDTDSSTAIPNVSAATFAALQRAREIHRDCRSLLPTRAQKTGLEIMEAMASHIESGCMKIYRYARAQCQRLLGEMPSVSPLLRQALVALQDRPLLASYCLQEAQTARRESIRRCFNDALTGTLSSNARPIELQAHDPLRYTSDMTAWLHQTLAGERELFSRLIPPPTASAAATSKQSISMTVDDADDTETDQMESRRFSHSQTSESDPSRERDAKIRSLLSGVLDSAAKLLKSRFEGILLNEPGSVVCYRLSALLQFYGNSTIRPLLSEESLLVETIEQMRELALKTFYDGLEANAAKLVNQLEPCGPDLLPPPAFSSTIAILRDILSSHDSSLVNADITEEAFTRVLRCTVDPLMHACAMAASDLSSDSAAVFTVNCLYTIETTLSLYEFTAERLSQLELESTKHRTALVTQLTQAVLKRCGLLLDVQKQWDATAVDAASVRLESVFTGTDEWVRVVMPVLDRLLSTRARTAVREAAIEGVCVAYETAYNAVLVTDPAATMRRSPNDIKLIM